MALSNHTLVFIFGILGNIISTGVFFAPLPTFHHIYKKKSTQGFQSLPYLVALFSASLWLYYAVILQSDATLLLTINSFGCFIQFIYIIFYIAYATREAKDLTVKILVLMNVGLFSAIILLTYYLAKGDRRVKVVGWICSAISVSVFAAPLGILYRVVQTKSVEFMPFTLSAFLTVSATIWFFYGLLRKDYYIAAPNILGFIFGIVQMVLYAIYRKSTEIKKERQLPAEIVVINIAALRSPEVHQVDVRPNGHHENAVDEEGEA